MSFDDAIALQPLWVQVWLNWLLFSAFLLPLALLIWRESRVMGVVTVLAGVLSGVLVQYLYGQLGYVRLLGLGHLPWVPLAIWQGLVLARGDWRVWPRRILWVVFISISISLVFDAVDVARWVLGARDPMI